jgi:hypothetical protein
VRIALLKMRAAKLIALRSAVTTAIGLALLPVPPLIEIITQYAIEDFRITQLIGKTGKSGDVDNCHGLKALLSSPSGIALVCSTDEILIADTDNLKVRLYSLSDGIAIPTAAPAATAAAAVALTYVS